MAPVGGVRSPYTVNGEVVPTFPTSSTALIWKLYEEVAEGDQL
jgi:hypothetical protein